MCTVCVCTAGASVDDHGGQARSSYVEAAPTDHTHAGGLTHADTGVSHHPESSNEAYVQPEAKYEGSHPSVFKGKRDTEFSDSEARMEFGNLLRIRWHNAHLQAQS